MMRINYDIIIGKLINLSNNIKNERLNRKFKNVKFIGKNEITNINNVTIGEYSCFKDSYIESSGGVEIGSYVHGAINLVIWSSNHVYNSEMIPFNYEYVYKKVIIKDFVWIGEGVKILPGITIGEGAIIGMGSVVREDIPDYAIACGNPAKVIKYRDIDCFVKNKMEKNFRGL